MQPYDARFFDFMSDSAGRSAGRVVPLVADLVRPRSVVDVGCGTGAWVEAFRRQGVEDAWGVDGQWVDPATLRFPAERFVRADLSRPLDLGRRFDLVVSLEVAEHLPEASAPTFVDSLAALGPVVLFSAAIPHQGGTHHVNERWQDYWAGLFAGRGYAAIDCVRSRVWGDDGVDWFYAQNTLLYASAEGLEKAPALRAAAGPAGCPLRLVHPGKFLQEVELNQKIAATAADLARVVAPGEVFVLVDLEQLRGLIAVGSRALPFTERDGQYWGPPADDAAAVAETERLRAAGARKLVIAWSAFWWLDYYTGWRDYLHDRYPCTFRNDRLVAFDLSPGTAPRP